MVPFDEATSGPVAAPVSFLIYVFAYASELM
jgi:hypothetical protein